MFRFLRRYVSARKKLIFRFHDGQRNCCADPIVVAGRLKAHPQFLPQHLIEARDGDAMAIKIVGDAACHAFDVQPLDGDGNGLTLSDRVALLLAFDYWVDALKKNTPPSSV